MRILENIRPARVFYYFKNLSGIPRGSGNTAAVSAYCAGVAEKLGLACRRDECGNVIIKKPAAAGYEDHPAVILQAHLDMVCEKETGVIHDFTRDGLALGIDGDFLHANGTTLGADDGIGVAMTLAILEDSTLSHPAIEAIFTTDEETGMTGAIGLDASDLQAKTLINLDSESEGVLTVSGAGGARAELRLPLTFGPVSGTGYEVVVDGLIGGHSGGEINKGRQNANILMGQFLRSLGDVRLIAADGGLKDNAIPRRAVCRLVSDADVIAAAAAFSAENRVDTDPGLTVTATRIPTPAAAITAESSAKVITLLTAVKNGVQAMSCDIEGLVQTSLNLGILKTDGNALSAFFAVRSSVPADTAALLDELRDIITNLGGTYSTYNHYPAWEYSKNSRLRDIMVRIFEAQYGRKPVVQAIHAGLECGLFCGKIPGLDAVSCGPDMFDIHTGRERLSVSSTERTYNYLRQVLEAL